MSLFDKQKCEEIIARINKLTPESSAAWGKMNVGEMLCHCADSIKMATGERETADKSSFLFRHLVKPLVIYVLPVPKSVPTADEINPFKNGTKPSEFEADRNELLASINNLCSLPESHVWAKHPAFGKLSARQWGLLSHKHTAHHLNQFGV